jgi:hypothetical protein
MGHAAGAIVAEFQYFATKPGLIRYGEEQPMILHAKCQYYMQC